MDVQQCLCSALLYQKTFRYRHVVVAALIKAQYRRYDWVSPTPPKAIISVLSKRITSYNTWFWLLSSKSGSIPLICAFLIWPSQKNSKGPDVLFASIFSSITAREISAMALAAPVNIQYRQCGSFSSDALPKTHKWKQSMFCLLLFFSLCCLFK